MAKLTKEDLEHLDEGFDALGLGQMINGGHLTDRTYDSEELNEAVRKIDEGYRTLHKLYWGGR